MRLIGIECAQGGQLSKKGKRVLQMIRQMNLEQGKEFKHLFKQRIAVYFGKETTDLFYLEL